MANESTQAQVVIVTGAGSGIGREIALDLSGRGCKLVLTGRRREPLEETARFLVGDPLVVSADIRKPADAHCIIDETIRHFGRLDVLINNAGAAPCMSIDKHTPAIIDDTFAVNALGPAYLIARAWKVWEDQNAGDHAAGRNPGGGCIVNISSMATVDPFPGLFAYAAAKGALSTMIKSCHNEGKDLGIRAFCVSPGAVETAMLRAIVDSDMLPHDRTLSPKAVAVIVAECIAGLRDDVAGQVLLLPSP